MKMRNCKSDWFPLALIFLAGLRVAAQNPATLAGGAPTEDPPNTHNMLVVGSKAVFLSHLPMFKGLNSYLIFLQLSRFVIDVFTAK